MSSIAPITTYVADGQNYLRQQSKNRPNINALLQGFLGHSQDIEDALNGLQDGLLLANATGAALDNIGSMVGVQRDGLDDATYKVLVQGQIAANHGTATLNSAIAIISKLFDTTTVFTRTPLLLPDSGKLSGAFFGYAVGSPGLPQALWPLAQKLVAKTLGAGVSLEPPTNFNSSGAFGFASDGGASSHYIGGWGDINDASVGAPLASLL